jgi:hypothetical protein
MGDSNLSVQKLPPEAQSPGPEDGGPRRHPKPNLPGYWQFMAETDRDEMFLRQTRRGVDLYLKTMKGSAHGIVSLMDAMRGFRAIQRGDDVAEDGYDYIASGRWTFICSMAPGEYHLEPQKHGGSILWWKDLDPDRDAKPALAPEIEAIIPPKPKRTRPRLLTEAEKRAMRRKGSKSV